MSTRMPASRTSTRSATARRAMHSGEIDMTTILVPDPAEEGPSVSKKRKDKRPQGRRPLVSLGEVIEISSDDEPPIAPNPALVDLRRQLRKLKEEHEKCIRDLIETKFELSEVRQENIDLKAVPRAGKGKLVLDESQLGDSVNCEICTSRMWSPYILPDCGHTFCQPCLQDWFNTTLTQYMTTHPQYNINTPTPYMLQMQILMQNPHYIQTPQGSAMLAQIVQAAPQYTCPTCRKVVMHRPVEDFTLKSLVRTVATAAGESSPVRPRVMSLSGRGERRAAVSPGGPWDKFFPRTGI